MTANASDLLGNSLALGTTSTPYHVSTHRHTVTDSMLSSQRHQSILKFLIQFEKNPNKVGMKRPVCSSALCPVTVSTCHSPLARGERDPIPARTGVC
jgi:hypothetical protein